MSDIIDEFNPDLIYEPPELFNIFNAGNYNAIGNKLYNIGGSAKEIDESQKEFSEYKIKVSVGMLKQFSGPGTNFDILGLSKRGTEFIIIDEAKGVGAINWGRVKSKEIIWIPLEHCARVEP